jgi:hypothetical protein
MAQWLYLASNSKASSENTYRYAQHGFVWRPFFAKTPHLQAVANVKHLAAGDTLYVGYRIMNGVQLLGRCVVGRPDNPIDASPVFCQVPKDIEDDMRVDDYTDDPVLKALVGIFVTDIEPMEEIVELPVGGEQNSVVRLQDDLVQRTEPANTLARPVHHVATQVQSAIESPVVPHQRSAMNGLYIGVDVAGRPDKGFTLSFLDFSDGTLQGISFDSVLYDANSQLPPTMDLREAVCQSDFKRLAHATWSATKHLSAAFREKVNSRSPKGVFIDSPTAFSRNALGHGRSTEKAGYRGVSFQCTPSVNCGRIHRGDWNWLLYGIVAYASLIGDHLSEEAWEDRLANGIYPLYRQANRGVYVRECFPTAMVSVLRENQAAVNAVKHVLSPLKDRESVRDEVEAVFAYLDFGVRAVKTRAARFDRADALVASLLALPQVMPDTFRETERIPPEDARWAGNAGAVEIEGRIASIELR